MRDASRESTPDFFKVTHYPAVAFLVQGPHSRLGLRAVTGAARGGALSRLGRSDWDCAATLFSVRG